MNIMYDARAVTVQASGVGKIVKQLLSELLARDTQNRYVVIVSPGTAVDLREFHNASVINAPYRFDRHPLREWWEKFVLLKKIVSLNIDLYIGPSFSLPFGMDRAFPVKKAVIIYDVTAFDCPKTMPFMFRQYMRYIIRRSLRHADMIITASRFTRERIETLFPHARPKIIVIPVWIEGFFYDREKDLTDTVRKKYKLPAPYVLTVGNLEPRKNIKTLIAAMQILWRNDFAGDLVIVGQHCWGSSSWHKELAKGMISRIHFPGYVPDADLKKLYSLARIFVFPTLYEGFGIPPLEAMACGTPVICSDRASLPEVVGTAAYMIDPAKADHIAHAIHTVYSEKDVADELVRKGFEHVKENRWKSITDAYLRLFTEL